MTLKENGFLRHCPKLTPMRLEPEGSLVQPLPGGRARRVAARTDWSRVDATTEDEIATHAAQDDRAAMIDAANWARGVRLRLGLSRTEFSRHIAVPVATVRDWENGRQVPAGMARVLSRIIDRVPAAALTG